MLKSMGYSLQSNRKTREGKEHPDRNAQFEHIATTVEQFQHQHRPVISIDTKKKELVGNFHNQGQEWQPQGEPIEVNVHDFPDKILGKAIPYGIYDLTQNQGWVNVGIDHDTAQFAVESIRHWWLEMGQSHYTENGTDGAVSRTQNRSHNEKLDMVPNSAGEESTKTIQDCRNGFWYSKRSILGVRINMIRLTLFFYIVCHYGSKWLKSS